jgi:hypothetical protein
MRAVALEQIRLDLDMALEVHQALIRRYQP